MSKFVLSNSIFFDIETAYVEADQLSAFWFDMLKEVCISDNNTIEEMFSWIITEIKKGGNYSKQGLFMNKGGIDILNSTWTTLFPK